MTAIILGRDAEVAAWVAARMPARTNFDKCVAIGVAHAPSVRFSFCPGPQYMRASACGAMSGTH